MKSAIKRKEEFANFWNNGFTMTEALMGLSVFCLVASFLPISFQLLNGLSQTSPRLQEMQWEVFTGQMKKEIRMAQKIDPQISRLILTKDTDSIIYEQNGTNIRRRVNFTGNEILLQNIKSSRFQAIKSGVKMEVEDIWGKRYSFSTTSYLDLGQ